jgi:site-specific recombinase XerD
LSFVVSPFVGRLLGLNSARQYRGRKTTAAWSENGTRITAGGHRNPAAPQCGHACGFKLANDGVDTRTLQHYLGHRNIQHTVQYTELRSDRFNGLWKD